MTKKLAVLGLDGVDYSTVNNPEEFPWFGTQFHEGKADMLRVDTYPHTNPSWALAFTGFDVANGLDIKGFKGMEDGEPYWYTSDDIPKPFIWDILEHYGYTVRRSNWLGWDLKFNGDFKYDCEYIDERLEEEHDRSEDHWHRHMLEVGSDEIGQSMHKQWSNMKALVNKCEPNALISYHHGPDLAGHIFRQGPGDMDRLITDYHKVEDLTREMYDWLTDRGYDVLYLSDHGLPDGGTRWKGEQVVTHKSTGIIGGTLDLPERPKMSDVFDILVDYFDVDPDVDVESESDEMSEEEQEYVESQLKGLGYL